MKTFGKILICIIVVLAAVGIAYLVYDGKVGTTNTSSGTNTNSSNTNKQNTTNNTSNNTSNNTTNETANNTEKEDEFIGKEENKEEPEESAKTEQTNPEQQTQELTGKDKAIDIVKKQYALDGQIVRFNHMEGNDYIIKMNDGTAVTWYVVNGTTWEAEEY